MPRVGTYYWAGGWNNGHSGDFEQPLLVPEEFHERLPFYGFVVDEDTVSVRGNSQAVVDHEIAAARAGGIDYFSYLMVWGEPNFVGSNAGTSLYGFSPYFTDCNTAFKHHLTSTRKSWVKFCLTLLQGSGLDIIADGHTPAGDWPVIGAQIVGYMLDPDYERTEDGRPLLYWFNMTASKDAFGGDVPFAAAIQAFRDQCTDAGLETPFIVSAEGGPSDIATWGIDCKGKYYVAPGGDPVESPYADLAFSASGIWPSMPGEIAVPLATSGWDYRPRVNPVNISGTENTLGPWTTQPTPAELSTHVKACYDYCVAHPERVPGGSFMIYAWNEMTEGGWLVPSRIDCGMRLQSIAQKLGKQRSRPSALRRRGVQVKSR